MALSIEEIREKIKRVDPNIIEDLSELSSDAYDYENPDGPKNISARRRLNTKVRKRMRNLFGDEWMRENYPEARNWDMYQRQADTRRRVLGVGGTPDDDFIDVLPEDEEEALPIHRDLVEEFLEHEEEEDFKDWIEYEVELKTSMAYDIIDKGERPPLIFEARIKFTSDKDIDNMGWEEAKSIESDIAALGDQMHEEFKRAAINEWTVDNLQSGANGKWIDKPKIGGTIKKTGVTYPGPREPEYVYLEMHFEGSRKATAKAQKVYNKSYGETRFSNKRRRREHFTIDKSGDSTKYTRQDQYGTESWTS